MNDNLILVLAIFATIIVTGAIWSTLAGRVRRLEHYSNSLFQALKHQDKLIKDAHNNSLVWRQSSADALKRFEAIDDELAVIEKKLKPSNDQDNGVPM